MGEVQDILEQAQVFGDEGAGAGASIGVGAGIGDAVNGTLRGEVPPGGAALAYGSLVFMALLPILIGSFRSLKSRSDSKDGGDRPETMTASDAMIFPFIASAALFSLYIIYQVFSADYFNLLLSVYFFFLGVLALSHLLSSMASNIKTLSVLVPHVPFQIMFKYGSKSSNYDFTSFDLVCLGVATLVGIWYTLTKHWIANNLFGLAFAINGVELLRLDNVVTGCILLCGLFIYDIFWVFGTNVMVTVAKSFEVPIKLVFPQDILVNGFNAHNFAMLGLGDIVVPGIFIALLLRFDRSLNRNSNLYFYTTFLAYFLGLLTTIFVMHVFKHAQPALLYLVPACLSTPLLMALIKGDINVLFAYRDEIKEEETTDTKKKN